jgi:hypothetical protein
MDSEQIKDFEDGWNTRDHHLFVITVSPPLVEMGGEWTAEDLEIIAEFLRKMED